jgi:DegV family protein with EDD domain
MSAAAVAANSAPPPAVASPELSDQAVPAGRGRATDAGKGAKAGVMVDSACDLPPDFIARHGIGLLPITLRVGRNVVEDWRDPIKTLAFYAEHLDQENEDFAESMPFSVERVESLFMDRMVMAHEHVFCVTITAARSPILANVEAAMPRIQARAREQRALLGLSPRFAITPLSSRNLFTGQGIVAAEAVRYAAQGRTVPDITLRLKRLAEITHTYLVPADLFQIYRRASKKGESSISWGAYTLGQMLDVKPILHCNRDKTAPVAKVRGIPQGFAEVLAAATQQIRAGLAAPVVVLSYGGDIAAVPTLPGFAELQRVAKEHGIEVLVSTMSMTAAVNVGPGALAVSFAADDHVFKN